MYGISGSSVILFLLVDSMGGFTFRVPIYSNRANKRLGVNSRAFSQGNGGEESQVNHLSNRTCIRQFLTQRSIQSFLFLLSQCRDPHTVRWIEDFGDSGNLSSYHGTGALIENFPHWDDFFNGILLKPVDVVQVQVPHRGRAIGLSANNPNREKEEQKHKPLMIDIDIDPPSLAGRILSVRELLGREWKDDLDLVRIATEKILSSYDKNLHDNRKDEVNHRNAYDSPDSSTDSHRSTEFDSFQDPSQGNNPHRQTFDRTEIYMLNNHAAFDDIESSPLRKSNFDLLFLLSTQEAVHRTLKSYMKREKMKTAFVWLRTFYSSRLEKYFDGNQRYGAADDFFDDLLLSPPSVQSSSDGALGLIDPLQITGDIINARIEVIDEWKCILDLVSAEHKDLKRQIFIKQMEKWGQRIQNPSKVDVVQPVNEFE